MVGLIGAFMTAAYMTRCVYLTFFGEYRGHEHPHESPSGSITVPARSILGTPVASCRRLRQRRADDSALRRRSSDWVAAARSLFPSTLNNAAFD